MGEALTEGGGPFTVDSELLTYYAIVFSKLNCTSQWYLAVLANTSTTIYYLVRCYAAFGEGEPLNRTAHCLVSLIIVHALLCYKEEMALRREFYKELDLVSTRDSFKRTIDSVPEALLIRSTTKEPLFTNKAWKKTLARMEHDFRFKSQHITVEGKTLKGKKTMHYLDCIDFLESRNQEFGGSTHSLSVSGK